MCDADMVDWLVVFFRTTALKAAGETCVSDSLLGLLGLALLGPFMTFWFLYNKCLTLGLLSIC